VRRGSSLFDVCFAGATRRPSLVAPHRRFCIVDGDVQAAGDLDAPIADRSDDARQW
jgi:hypothetical protein